MSDFELFMQYNYEKNLSDEKFLDFRLNKNFYQNDDKAKWLILLHGTYNCNADCIYCENHVLRETYNHIVISEELVREIVQKLGPHTREFTWHGGESLLLPENIIYAMYDEKKKNNFDFIISLQSNGILLTKEKQKFLDNLDIQVGHSFDGIYNTTHRGQASTSAMINLITNKPSSSFGFITVYTADNIHTLISNYEFYKKLKVTNFQSCVVRENVEEGDNKYLVSNEQAIPAVLKYIDYWIHDTNDPIVDRYIQRQIERLLGNVGLCEYINCVGGWLIIDPLGNITTCGKSAKNDSFCNIKDISSYEDLLNNKKFQNTFYKQIELIQKECLDCQWYKVCYGGCMGLNYEKNHNYEQLNERNCEFTKQLLLGIYELIKDIDINDTNHYNKFFLEILKKSNYYSLSKIKEMEKKFNALFI